VSLIVDGWMMYCVELNMILCVGSYNFMTTGTHHSLEVLNNEFMMSVYQITLST
jgi:hypothetical protein